MRRRPKDRKAQIAGVSAEAFSDLGYHAVSMEDIARRVGVSAAALYRHSPSKYDLFRDAVLSLSQQLVDGTEVAGSSTDGGADLFTALVTGLVDVSIRNRSTGGVYRWGGRYLTEQDSAILGGQLELVNRRLQEPLVALRPDLTSHQRWTLSVGVLSVIGSLVDHKTTLSAGRIQQLFAKQTAAVFWADIPELAPSTPPSTAMPPATGTTTTGRYEAVLRASMTFFHLRGYRETTVDDIAAAVGMPASGIYRYFPGKADILAALFRRAADRLSGDTAEILSTEADPKAALDQLVASYVARSFDNPEIDYLYFTERTSLPSSDRTMLHNIQRANVEEWSRLLAAIHSDLTEREARFVVHAAFALVIDLGRLTRYENSEAARAVVCALMRAALLAPSHASARTG
ncbi:MAG: helix-turn-helix transcriptional regulator [Mycolicibacterium cosmeticum]|nr:helix-turn-helix transcriptional regulator [Mycolicibacterium cosmeticum]